MGKFFSVIMKPEYLLRVLEKLSTLLPDYFHIKFTSPS